MGHPQLVGESRVDHPPPSLLGRVKGGAPGQGWATRHWKWPGAAVGLHPSSFIKNG
jgi:hypothetical protein